MGEVYGACDWGLGRDVAIKVLPVSISLDADRRPLQTGSASDRGAQPPQHSLHLFRETMAASAAANALYIESLSGISGSTQRLEAATESSGRKRAWLARVAIAGAAVLLAAGIGVFLGRRLVTVADPSWHRLTFNRGNISMALCSGWPLGRDSCTFFS
jgi:hypothetical protein